MSKPILNPVRPAEGGPSTPRSYGISFNIFDEASQTYADKFYAFADTVLSAELQSSAIQCRLEISDFRGKNRRRSASQIGYKTATNPP
jgi:hypothetical protein